MSSGFVRRHDQHGDLRALALFERGEFAFERLLLLRVERAGEIGDARGQRRDRLRIVGRRRRRNRDSARTNRA